MSVRLLVVAAALLSCLGCDATGSDESDLTGRWRGQYRGNEIELDLVRTGTRIAGTGTWRTDGGADISLRVDGVYEHPDVAIELESTSAPYVVSGVFEGVVDDDRREMSGNFGAANYLIFYRR